MQSSFRLPAVTPATLGYIPAHRRLTRAWLVSISLLFVLLVSAVPGEAQAVPTAADSAETPPVKIYHDGSIHDISAIGKRNVGCGRGLGNWYTLEKQVAMGKQLAREVESANQLIRDPVVTEYVDWLAQILARKSDARVPFTVRVIESDDNNAFGLPGGFFYVTSGLLLACENEAELAGVMAHEVAHIAACHAARTQTRSSLAKIASIPLIFAGAGIGGLVLPVTFMRFSRSFEAEADYLGVQYLYHAGYDPQAFLSFLERIAASEGKKPGLLARTFTTHPPTPDRMKKVQKQIATLLPPKSEYVLDSSEFADIKLRLAALEKGGSLATQGKHRPTLRGRGQGPSNQASE